MLCPHGVLSYQRPVAKRGIVSQGEFGYDLLIYKFKEESMTSLKHATVCLLVAAASLLVSCQKPKIVFATDPTEPPLESLNDAKQMVGFDVDMVRALEEAGGFHAELVAVNWDNIFSGLQAGKYDAVISGVTILDERKSTMDFSDPYLKAGQTLLVKSDSKVGGLRDLSGKTVGAAWPPALEALAEQAGSVAFTRKNFDSEHDAVAAVAKGEVDALLLDEPLALYYANKNPEYKGLLKTVGGPIVDQSYGIAMKKGNTKVLEVINRALSKVRGSSQDMHIRKQWIE